MPRCLNLLSTVLVLSSLLAACDQAPAQKGEAPSPPPVTVAKPVVKTIVELDDFTGRFAAVGSVEVRARVGGYIDTIPFADGTMLKQGDLLFVIDRRPFQSALNQATAALNSARTRHEFARLELERSESLLRTGAGTQRTLDERRQAFSVAQSDIQSAQASIDQARLDLGFTEIRAPIAGRVGRKLVTEGNLIQANETLLTTIVQLDPIYFYFDVDERFYLAAQRRGQNGGKIQVGISLSDEREAMRQATLDFTDNRLDDATGTMRLRAVVANGNHLITPGMFGRVAIPSSESYRAALIPDEAILSDLERRFVYVVNPDGTVAQRDVRPGPRYDGYRIVRTGLTGDELVVVSGLQRVRFAPKVTPQVIELPPVRTAEAASGKAP